jgi:hypothetical protein
VDSWCLGLRQSTPVEVVSAGACCSCPRPAKCFARRRPEAGRERDVGHVGLNMSDRTYGLSRRAGLCRSRLGKPSLDSASKGSARGGFPLRTRSRPIGAIARAVIQSAQPRETFVMMLRLHATTPPPRAARHRPSHLAPRTSLPHPHTPQWPHPIPRKPGSASRMS